MDTPLSSFLQTILSCVVLFIRFYFITSFKSLRAFSSFNVLILCSRLASHTTNILGEIQTDPLRRRVCCSGVEDVHTRCSNYPHGRNQTTALQLASTFITGVASARGLVLAVTRCEFARGRGGLLPVILLSLAHTHMLRGQRWRTYALCVP